MHFSDHGELNKNVFFRSSEYTVWPSVMFFFKDQMHAFKVDDVYRYINNKSRPICLYRLINLILTHYACLFNFLTATIVKIKVARGSARVARLWRTFEILVPYVFTCGNYAFCIFTFGSNRSSNVRRILLIRDSLILN